MLDILISVSKSLSQIKKAGNGKHEWDTEVATTLKKGSNLGAPTSLLA